MAPGMSVLYTPCIQRRATLRGCLFESSAERDMVESRRRFLAGPQLFVVVSTGQNVANLPPVLEWAEVGDWVLWVESEVAERGQWSKGAREVLHQRGLRVLKKFIRVRQVNDPVQVAHACRDFLDGLVPDQITEEWPDQHERTAFREFLVLAERGLVRTFLVCNGGNKLTPIGLLQGCARLRPVALYGDDSPAVCWSFSEGLEASPFIRSYQRETLDLPDVLTTSGHYLLNQGVAERFWPGPLPSHLAQEQYGKDGEYTRFLHDKRSAWSTAESSEELPSYQALSELLAPERIDQWKRALVPLSGAGKGFGENVGMLRSLYHATINLAQAGSRAKGRLGMSPPEAKISDAFERAVAARIHTWLNETNHPAVQSAWRNVEVAREGRKIAQFDVLLVLKNGILWHLECKSATAGLKDLDARLLNLQQAGSLLARMAVCAPILTQYASERWFEQLQALRDKIETLSRVPFVPFSLPNQPSGYSWPDQNGEPLMRECPSFETRLEHFLRPFRP